MTNPQAPVLDHLLGHSYEVIRYVHDHMAAIEAVASHLTPVEDLVSFRSEVEQLHAQLGLLVEASSIIVDVTDAGYDLITAADAAAQRVLLQLRSAALHDAAEFANAVQFTALQATVTALAALVNDYITTNPGGYLTGAQVEALLVPIRARLTALESVVGDGSIGDIEDRLDDIEGNQTTIWEHINAVTVRVTDTETGLTGLASITQTLTARVDVTEAGITSLAASTIALTAQVGTLEDGVLAQAGAIQTLETRASNLEGDLSSASSAITALTAQVTDLANDVDLQGTAISSLTTRVSSTEAGLLVVSEETTQLGARITDAETGLVAAATATEALTVRVQETEDGLTIAAERDTALTASITSSGNMAPNSGFEVDLRNWTIFSRGAGWLDAVLTRNLDPMDIPNGVNTLSVTQDEVPLGNLGIRSTKIPIEDGKDYFLSGYVAAENCRVRLEWRTFAPDGSPLEMGIVGQSIVGLPASLGAWPRPFVKLPASNDARLLEIQLWVMECHTDFPKAWLARPMLEQSVGVQNAPSPWTDSMSGLETAMATAYQTLNVRVTETESGLTALAEALTELEASIGGGFSTYRVVTYGGDDFAAVGAPMEAGIYKPGDPASDLFERGLTLVRFAPDNSILSSTTYDTFASGTERDNLATALNALTPSQGFALVGAHAHGIKYAPLTAAIKAVGGLGFNEVPGSYPYLLLGRGGIGEGMGIELFRTFGGNFIDHTFELSSGIPKGLGQDGNLVLTANALSALTVRVTDAEGVLDSHATQLTTLTARLDDPVTGLAAQAAATSALEARVTSAEGVNTAQAASLISLDSRLDTAEGDLAGAASAISSLTTRVTTAEGNITSIADSLVSLDSRLDDAEADITATAGAVSSLTTRVTTAEGNITSQAGQITALTTSLGNIGGGNLAPNPSMELDVDTNGVADSWGVNGTGTGRVASLVASSLPHSTLMQRIVSTMTNAQYHDLATQVANRPVAQENKQHTFSAYVMGTVGSGALVYIQWVNSGGGIISTLTGTTVNLAASWQRLQLTGLAPAGTVKAVLIIRAFGVAAGAASATLNIDNVQFQVGQIATEYEPNINEGLQANASATQALDVRVTAAEGVITTQATSITDLRAGYLSATNNPNLISNPTFEVDTTGWSSGGTGGSWLGRFIDSSGPYSGVAASGVGLYRTVWFDINPTDIAGFPISYSVDMYKTSTVGVVSADVLFLDSGGGVISTAPRAGPITVNSAWTRYGNTMTAPAGTVTVRFRFIVEGTNANDFWRRAKVERGSVTPYNTDTFVGGQARAMSTLSATVTSQGGLITSQGSAITSLTSTVAGKADVSAVTALTTRVTEMQGTGVNLLGNSTFVRDIAGWTAAASPAGGTVARDMHGFSWQPAGMHAMVMAPPTGTTINSDHMYMVSDPVPVEAGKEYIASAYMAAHRGNGFVYLIWRNQAGGIISTPITANTGLAGAGQDLATGYTRLHLKATAPANAKTVLVCYGWRKSLASPAGDSPYLWIIRPMFEEVGPSQTTPSKWNAGGTEMSATWSVTLDVNGLITGVSLGSDGTTSAMRIRADMFSIEGSSSGARTEFSSGNWRVYDAAGVMRVRLGVW